jgi:hypothetical protein
LRRVKVKFEEWARSRARRLSAVELVADITFVEALMRDVRAGVPQRRSEKEPSEGLRRLRAEYEEENGGSRSL